MDMRRYRFGRYELRPASGELLRDGRKLEVPGKQFQVLIALAEAAVMAMPVASPEWIVRKVWYQKDWQRGRKSLKVHISHLNERLDKGAIQFITTDGGERGYRLTDAVSQVTPALDLHLRPFAFYGDHLTWLAAAPAEGAAALARWQGTARSIADVVARHGGQQAQAADQVLSACFPGPSAAIACSRRLHQLLDGPPLQGSGASLLRVLLLDELAVDPIGTARRQAAVLGVRDVPAGQTWLPAGLALVDTLDGDVMPLPAQASLQPSWQENLVQLVDPKMDPRIEPASRPTGRQEYMVAVIPFSPETPESSQDLPLGNILAHVLTAVLHRSKIIQVIAFQSAVQFRNRPALVRQIAQALDADYVVTGQYSRDNRHIDVWLQVADGKTEALVNECKVHGLQNEVRIENSPLVLELASQIVVPIVRAELPRAQHTPLPDLPSHTLLLAGIHLMFRLSPADHLLSQQALQTLHERVRRHAVPLAWLALWHVFRLAQGWSDNRARDIERAESFAERALDIDADSSLALTMMGSVCTLRPERRSQAMTYFDGALLRNPNEAMAWLQKGNALSFAGRGTEGLGCVETALRLSPLDPARHYYLALMAGAALSAGQWGRAASGAQRSLLLNQRHVPSHRVLAIALMLDGRIEEGRAAVTRLRQLQPALTAASYVADSPGKTELARNFARALRDGGLPQGPIELD